MIISKEIASFESCWNFVGIQHTKSQQVRIRKHSNIRIFTEDTAS